MFENILGLDGAVADLSRDIDRGTLPQAILLTGPRYGGKSSVALELARVLTCSGGGSWGCTCRNCRLQRGLQHPDTIMVGDRYFDLEIAAAISSFRSEPRRGTAYLLVRAVRKLLRRFDGVLWQEAKLKKAESSITTINELLDEIEPADNRTEPWKRHDRAARDRILMQLADATERLRGSLPHDPVPVDMVRAIGSWAHLSSGSGARVVIIEEAHLMHDAARNGMLKILEEPPSGVIFVLTTSRRTAMIPTILSRVRAYHLTERTPESQRQVIERVFRAHEGVPPLLNDFFRSWNHADQSWRELAREVLDSVSDPVSFARIHGTIRDQIGTGPPRKGAEYFLDALLEEERRRLRDTPSPGDVQRIGNLAATIREHWERIDTRNMNVSSVIESLLVTLRERGAA